jgi:tRNA pseudouridine38-40 synthase
MVRASALISDRPRPGPPEGSNRTIRIDVQYEGTEYVGWQRQARGESVQGLLEKALSNVADEKITLHGASRTDAGVHARQQIASFSLRKCTIPADSFLKGANSILPLDIRVTYAEETDLHFLAGASAKQKTYRYFISTGSEPNVFTRRYAWHVRGKLDGEAIRKGSRHFLGTHDFASFRAANSETRSSVRTLTQLDLFKGEWGHLYFEVTGDGFLKHMVRIIVGTLVEVGLGKRSEDEIPKILAARNRTKAGRSAPPQGLFLWKIDV